MGNWEEKKTGKIQCQLTCVLLPRKLHGCINEAAKNGRRIEVGTGECYLQVFARL